jgi:hypothetical protein
MPSFLVYYTTTAHCALPIEAGTQDEAEAKAKAMIEGEIELPTRIDVDGQYDLDFTEQLDD